MILLIAYITLTSGLFYVAYKYWMLEKDYKETLNQAIKDNKAHGETLDFLSGLMDKHTEMLIERKALREALSEKVGGIEMMQELTDKIRTWAIMRGLDDADPTKQMLKLFEEIGEIASGMARGDVDEIKDGIGDVVVVLTILAMQLGTNIEECTQLAYNEIKDRRGKMVDGIFVKESDLT